MAQLRVLLNFAAASDHDLEETAGHVLTSLYGNPVYPSPPVPTADLQAALTAFTDAIAAQGQGGTQATAAKEQAREALILPLRRLALYVQSTIQGNPAYGLAELLGSGFDAVSTNRAQQPLDTPSILRIDNAGTGALTLRVGRVDNARMYEVQSQTLPSPAMVAAGLKADPGPWTSAGMFSSTRGMTVTGLMSGAMYNFQVRAIGGATGQSDWSDAVSHMSL